MAKRREPRPLACAAWLTVLLLGATVAEPQEPVPLGAPDDPLGPVPEVVARVNDIDLTAAELARKIRQMIPQVSFHQTIPKSRARELRRDALEALILETLKWQEAEREGTVATDADVRGEVDRVIAGLPPKERTRWLGEELTLVQRHGAAIRRRLTLERAEERHVPAAPEVSEERVDREIAAHPDLAQLPPQVRLRHLLVKVDPGSVREEYEARQARVESLRARIAGGEEFGEVAREASDDVFRERGGETDWLTEDEIIYAPVARAAFALEPGTLSAVIESLHGFHLIEVIERRAGKELPEDEVRARVRAMLPAIIRAELTEAWHARLLAAAKIERLYDPLAEGAESSGSTDGTGGAPTSRPAGHP